MSRTLSTFIATCILLTGGAFAQQGAQPSIDPREDTIGERANAALERGRAPNAARPVAPQTAPVQPSVMQRAGAAPDFSVTGIRGFATSLEASYLINGKRATGSVKFPTLVDGWSVISISPSGSVIAKIEKTKAGLSEQRKSLSFSGPSPYQTSATATQQGAPQGPPMPFPTVNRSDVQTQDIPASAPPPIPSLPSSTPAAQSSGTR
jgi:hypothetical protein